MIDVGSELDAPKTASRRRAARLRGGRTVLVSAMAGVSALVIVVALAAHRHGAHATDDRGTVTITMLPTTLGAQRPPTQPDQPPDLASVHGRFHPAIDQTDRATVVLPSGQTITLSGGLRRTIGGLGANFSGLVMQKSASVCCSLIFGISRAAPRDLFDTLGTGAISTPALVAATQAKLADLRQFKGDYGLLSTGQWTLVAAFDDGETTAFADATILERLASWRLSPTPNGAVLTVPVTSTIEQPRVTFGRTSDRAAREVDITPGCALGLFPRTIRRIRYEIQGSACEDGLQVTIFGPRSYVERAMADLEVTSSAGA